MKDYSLFIISGNMDVGSCCNCDTTDSEGNHTHIPQYTLYLCQNPTCDHYVCKKHLEPCGFCHGCCFEEHGLGSLDKYEDDRSST